MKIGIIVYSHTGHTLSVAMKLKERLSTIGHTVVLELIETAGPVSLSAASAELRTKPAIEAYEAVVLGTPVRGGVPSGPMMSYLEHVASLEGKKTVFLVTGFFPAGWGRDQTIGRLREICESKGGTVCGCGSVGWFSLRRKRQISQVVDDLSRCLE